MSIGLSPLPSVAREDEQGTPNGSNGSAATNAAAVGAGTLVVGHRDLVRRGKTECGLLPVINEAKSGVPDPCRFAQVIDAQGEKSAEGRCLDFGQMAA
jgi:hypothetical protein